jgi:hypothetical protein
MALTFVKRSLIPAAMRGKTGSLSVCVTKSGQLLLSSLVSKFLNGSKGVFVAFDGAKVYLIKPDSRLAAKADPTDIAPIHVGKKSKGASISGAGTLNSAKQFGASHVYPFAQSGNQSFVATVDEKNQLVSFELPATALVPKPVKARVKKVKPTSSQAEPTSPNTLKTDEELVLDAA